MNDDDGGQVDKKTVHGITSLQIAFLKDKTIKPVFYEKVQRLEYHFILFIM